MALEFCEDCGDTEVVMKLSICEELDVALSIRARSPRKGTEP